MITKTFFLTKEIRAMRTKKLRHKKSFRDHRAMAACRPVIMLRISDYGFGGPDGSGAALKNAELTTNTSAQKRIGEPAS
jgi:hypothetical protein